MPTSLSEYLIKKLKDFECKYVFGIPGTSCADFFFALETDPDIHYILATNELEAGYMADGYGRFRSIAAVCVSYGVGTLSLANAVASAYTEKVPLIILNGGPKKEDKRLLDEMGILFSHSTGRSNTDYLVFEQITIGCLLWEERMSLDKIDALFCKAIEELGPVYLEVPSDLWTSNVETEELDDTDKQILESDHERFLEVFSERFSQASRPAILFGSEILRRNLQPDALNWAEQLHIPFATTLLSKSAIDENHALFIGTYDSDLAPKLVKEILENSDCLITIGCIYSVDHTFLIKKHYDQMIDVSYNKGRIGKVVFANIKLSEFLNSSSRSLTRVSYSPTTFSEDNFEMRRARIGAIQPSICTHDTIFAAVNEFLKGTGAEYLAVSDTCLGSYPAADLTMPSTNMFLANPIWLSIGQGTPAGAGAYFATGKRPIIITGDGGFQMVSQTFATMVRYKIPAIIMVIDNGLYAIEQFLLDHRYFVEPEKEPIPFNILSSWKYESFPETFVGGGGARVTTLEDLTKALEMAKRADKEPYIIAIQIAKKDLPAENLGFINGDFSS